MAELSLNNLRINKKSKKKTRRVGRGNASGRGTYSGRGMKGQRSRSGGKGGLKRRGLANLLRNKPKLGGFRSLKPKMATINIDQLDKIFDSGDLISAKKLIAKRLIKPSKSGLKVLGEGNLTKKFTIAANDFSDSAKAAIIKAGGQVQIIARKKRPKPNKQKMKNLAK
ncbi:MAG: 50S ribosomal protein L15 [Candidatus Buchananbacteria bacterium]